MSVDYRNYNNDADSACPCSALYASRQLELDALRDGIKPVEAISQQVLDVVVLLGADASDTAKSGGYNLPEATLELDQDWTA